MAENLTPKKYIDDSNMKQILTAIKDKTPVGDEYITEEQLLAKDYATKTDEAKLFLKSLADGVNSFYSESENDEACLNDRKCKRTSSEPCVWFRLVMGTDPYEGWLCIGLTENSVKCTPLTEYSETSYLNFIENGITFYIGFMSYRYPTSQNYEFYITIDGKKYVPANRVYTVSIDKVSSLSVLNTWYNWQKICTTSVADVGWTVVTTTNPKISGGYIKYRVKNGICFVSVGGVESSATRGQTISNSLPKADSTNMYGGALTGSGDGENNGYMFISNGSTLIMNIKNTNTALYGSFSYPVAES